MRCAKTKKWIYSIGVAFCVVPVLLFLGPNGLLQAAEDRYAELQNFAKVLNLVQQYYVEPVDTKKLIYGGIRGMLRELDPHTNFLPPDIFKEFENETSGEFGGIGIEMSVQNGILTIISPIEDTPAWNAGIKPGDKVVGINGKSTKGLSLVEAAQLMRGKKGEKVSLSIIREGLENPKDYVIVRGSVKIKSVKYTDMEDGFAYVRITSFIENTSKDLKKIIESHITKQKQMKGLIIDLRRNPGGLLDQAINVSDLFLESGTIVSTIGRDKSQKEVATAKKEGTFPNFPLVILINEFSASASEIVAGALQDNKRAMIMGERSFGKGSVQSVVKLGDGSGLKLTVARYYTPSGRSIQAEGIQPDVAIENIDPDVLSKALVRGEGGREKDIAGHLMGEKEKEDSQKTSSGGIPWWKDTDDKTKERMTAKEKLLNRDYQVLQAYNYVRAWETINDLKTK
ncbi:MAG: S41 family peptidase [Pseudobdellovibrionaceae bacterium]